MNVFIIFFSVITLVKCANILIAYETARRSHQIWIGELAEALMKRGHNITMGGSFSRAIEEGDLYHPITFEGIFLTHYKSNKSAHFQSNYLQRLRLNHEYNWAICNKTYHSKGFNTLWHYPDEFKFELILIDMTFGPCLYPLIQRFGTRAVGFSPSRLSPYLIEKFGKGEYSLDIESKLLTTEEGEDSLLSRIGNYLVTKVELLFKRFIEPTIMENLAEQLLNDTFDYRQLEKNISLLLVNDPLIRVVKKSDIANIKRVGGLHIRKADELPVIMNMIVENANQGIVLFSIGTDIQSNVFSKNTKNEFANAFIRLEQKTVIWKDKMEPEDMPFRDRPSNILIHKWVPQNDLLAHSHTKVFLTTGGTLSIQEAICHGVPVVGIPIYDDHHKNIQYIVENNLGLKLDYNNLTEQNIYITLNQVLSNPIYWENMKALSKNCNQDESNSLDIAVEWVEFALEREFQNHEEDIIFPIHVICLFVFITSLLFLYFSDTTIF